MIRTLVFPHQDRNPEMVLSGGRVWLDLGLTGSQRSRGQEETLGTVWVRGSSLPRHTETGRRDRRLPQPSP